MLPLVLDLLSSVPPSVAELLSPVLSSVDIDSAKPLLLSCCDVTQTAPLKIEIRIPDVTSSAFFAA